MGWERGGGGTHIVFSNGVVLPEALPPILLGFNPAIEHLQSSAFRPSAPVLLGWWTPGVPGVPGRTIFLGTCYLLCGCICPEFLMRRNRQRGQGGKASCVVSLGVIE